MKIRTIAAVLFCSLALTASAGPTGGERATGRDPQVLTPGRGEVVSPSTLQVVLRCEDCQGVERPDVGLLWRAADGSIASRTVRTLDWAEGRFDIDEGGVARELSSTPVDGGWAVLVPLGSDGLPFRAQVALPGFVARQGAYWPASDLTVRTQFELQPTLAVLDANPSWDPGRTRECGVVVAKDARLPVTFYQAGEPRAWLFPAVDGGEGEWTFQFVRPGASLLERVSADVVPSDEGDSWSFQLPLEGVLADEAASPRSGLVVPADRPSPGRAGDVVERTRVPASAGALAVGDLGRFELTDCPRIPR